MEEHQRQFRGLWIPKEIWLNKNLTFQEKMLLVEIDSLEDDEKGCWASNKHFVEIFNINSSRISQIIQNLQKKGYINISYEKKGKEIIARHIFLNRPPYPEKIGMLKNNIGMLKNEIGVCQKVKGGYVKKLKENNININNTIENNKERNNKRKKIFEYVEKYFGITLSPTNYEKINVWLEEFDDEALCYGVDLCIEQNIKTLSYLFGILKSWKGKNYKTLEDIKNDKKTIKDDIDNEYIRI